MTTSSSSVRSSQSNKNVYSVRRTNSNLRGTINNATSPSSITGDDHNRSRSNPRSVVSGAASVASSANMDTSSLHGSVSPEDAKSSYRGGGGGPRSHHSSSNSRVGGSDVHSQISAASNHRDKDEARPDLHELAKGWKAAIARLRDPATAHEARKKNDRGNLPLHSAASFRAPLEVVDALLEVYPDAASLTNNYGNLALHFTAWKKGPLDCERLLLRIFPEGAAQRNNHGNLPLHYAAHYNAPLEVVEALYDAYPEAAHQQNNDANTPLDLAIADGASPNVVSLLQGKRPPPGDDEALRSAEERADRAETELRAWLEENESLNEDLDDVVSTLLDVRERHPHALYSASIDPEQATDAERMLEQIRLAAAPEASSEDDLDGVRAREDDDAEARLVEDTLVPPDDDVERALARVVGRDPVKNHVRGLRRTLERGGDDVEADLPRHLVVTGGPGAGKSFVVAQIAPLLRGIGAVASDTVVAPTRDDLVDPRSAARTVARTRRAIARARGGVLLLDDVAALLPSPARPRGRDHGGAALREIARALPGGDPTVVLAGRADEVRLVVGSDVGFRGHLLQSMECSDLSCAAIARVFFAEVHARGLVPGAGLTTDYLAGLIRNNTHAEWRADRNARAATALLDAVTTEMRRKNEANDAASAGTAGGTSTKGRELPLPGSKAVSRRPSDDVVVTVEDVHNAIMNGL